MYLTGHTYSTAYAGGGQQDIIVFKFSSDSEHTSPDGWGKAWGLRLLKLQLILVLILMKHISILVDTLILLNDDRMANMTCSYSN